ncbi:MAG: MFS transporter [Dehalococcoidia bacterium]|jgi:MFS family permease|nr:MFS transporter [Dehalococcoidia bacterium]
MATSGKDRDPAIDADVRNDGSDEITPDKSGGGSIALTVLGIVDFRYLFVANMMMFMAFQMRNVVQSWLALELTDSQAWVGVINGSPAVAIITLGLIGGVASDRWPKRDILLWVRIGLGLVNFAVGYLVMIDVISIWHLLFLSLAQGGAIAFGMPASQTIVQDIVGRNRLLTAVSLNQSLSTIGGIAGPALGGALLGIMGVAPVYFLISAIYIPAIYATWRIKTRTRVERTSNTSAITDIKEALVYVRSSAPLRILVVLNVLGLVAGFIFPIIPVYARDVLDVGESGFGILMAAFGVGALVGGLGLAFIGNVKHKGWLLMLAVVIGDPAVILFGFSRDFYFSTVLLFLFGVGAAFYITTVSTLFQTYAPERLRGKIMAVYALTLQLFPLGWMLGGFIADTLGAEMALVLGNGFSISVTLAMFAKSRTFRELT